MKAVLRELVFQLLRSVLVERVPVADYHALERVVGHAKNTLAGKGQVFIYHTVAQPPHVQMEVGGYQHAVLPQKQRDLPGAMAWRVNSSRPPARGSTSPCCTNWSTGMGS